MTCCHWSHYLLIRTHTPNQWGPDSNGSLSLSIMPIRVWSADTLWPVNMWTLHRVNWNQILWWADRLESIKAARIPVQQHTAESGQVMLPQANRQWIYWERHISAPNNNVLYYPFLRDFLILYLSLLWAINRFAVTKWFNLSRSPKSWKISEVIVKETWSDYREWQWADCKGHCGVENIHDKSLHNLSSKALFFTIACHYSWKYSFERLRIYAGRTSPQHEKAFT